MAATDPGPAETPASTPGPGEEPPTADLGTGAPRFSTRALLGAVVVLAVLLVVSGVVGFVVLHQPRLTPLPVPSVSSIA